MKDFLKNLASKMIVSAVKFYQNKTMQEIRRELAARYASLCKGISAGSRVAFVILVGAGVVGGGLVLFPLAICVGLAAITEIKIALAISFFVILVFSLIYIFVPLLICLIVTSEKMVRKGLGADEVERRILKQ